MKKKYSKPALYAESFQLVEHISSLCSTDFKSVAGHADQFQCCFFDEITGEKLFLTDTYNCEVKDDDFEGTYFNCYEVSSDFQLPFAGS